MTQYSLGNDGICNLLFMHWPKPIVNSLGASGYPALQTFLSNIWDRKNRLFFLAARSSLSY
jgi:hypothetical protein